MVTSLRVSSCFRTHFASKGVHGSQTLLEPALQRFYPNFSLIWDKVSWKRSPLVRSKILGLFCNTFNADRMSSFHRLEKLSRQVQTLLSQKRRTFSDIFLAFSECTQNFAHFETKDQPHSLNISEVIHQDNCGYLNAPKLLF